MSNTTANHPHDITLPKYHLRRSKRAKNLRLIISANHGLVCVIPALTPVSEAEAMIIKHQDWIQKQLKKFSPIMQQTPQLPTEILLRAVDQLWRIEYLNDKKSPRLYACHIEQKILIRGSINLTIVIDLLKHWLKKEAKTIFIPWLTELSYETKLTFNELKIKAQTTRWGSCSTQKNINLNYKLLFLPAVLVESVMLHELCHTVQMDHSKKFWNLMQIHNPLSLTYKEELKKANKYLPDWLKAQL